MSARPAPRAIARGFFVTGTDTGVGKTLVSCALMRAIANQGKRVAGMKPVAAGAIRTADGWLNDDVARLRAAANVTAPQSLLNPYCFESPIAPHLAARQVGVRIDLDVIARAYDELAAHCEFVVVEGVGGFCVPLNCTDDSAGLAQRLALPVVLVVGMRLGCLNHALLTAQALDARGLRLAGWVANRIDPLMASAGDNVAALTARLAAPLLGELEFTVAPDPQRIAALLDLSKLA